MRRSLVLVFLFLALAACGDDNGASPRADAGGAPTVLTTFYPTTYFAERLAGSDATVECPVPHDEDPIFYEPPRNVVDRFQQADLIVVNGAEFEKWVLTTSLPESRIVNTARPFKERWLRFTGTTEHSHGPAGAHTHTGLDGHTWLDPENAKTQVAEIARRLVLLLPDRATEIGTRRDALDADLDRLAEAWMQASAAYDGETLYASHPAYNYLAARYGWTVENLDLDPEAMPDDDALAEIRAKLEAKPARHILWESEPLPAIAKRFEDDLGLTSIVLSPCETLSPEALAKGEDYLTVMKRNVEAAGPALTPAD